MFEILKKEYGEQVLIDLRKAAMKSYPELKSKKMYDEWLTEYCVSFFVDLCEEYDIELDG